MSKVLADTPARTRLILVALLVGLAGLSGSLLTLAVQQQASTAYRPNSYNINVQNSVIVLNFVYVGWDSNSITLNMTNPTTGPVTDQVRISFVNGTIPIPGSEVFTPSFTAGEILVVGYTGWPFQLNNLVVGSTIRIQV